MSELTDEIREYFRRAQEISEMQLGKEGECRGSFFGDPEAVLEALSALAKTGGSVSRYLPLPVELLEAYWDEGEKGSPAKRDVAR